LVLAVQMEILKPMVQTVLIQYLIQLHLLAVDLVTVMQHKDQVAAQAVRVVVVMEGRAAHQGLAVLEIHQALHLLREIMEVMAILLLGNAVVVVAHQP
jgi:hypothetical protein